MLSISVIIGLLILLVGGWFWQNTMAARELAITATKDACARRDLQFLDDTVALKKLRLTSRTYQFEYADAQGKRHVSDVVVSRGVIVHLGLVVDSQVIPFAR